MLFESLVGVRYRLRRSSDETLIDEGKFMRDRSPATFWNPMRSGQQAGYCLGAIRNAEEAATVYPGWIGRFYVRKDVADSIGS